MDELSLVQWAPLPWFLVSPPTPTQPTLPRPRLHQLLDESVANHPLTLVSAVAGYGKTATLATWARSRSRPVAWLTLNSRTASDEVLLVGGLLSALHRLAPSLPPEDNVILSNLAFDPRGSDSTVEHLASACAALQEPVTIVINHAHLVGPQLAHGPIRILADHCPAQFRFVLLGEAVLTDWFNELHAEGLLTCIGASRLALTLAEIDKELEQPGTVRDGMTASQILAETGGWPIAVHLARRGVRPDTSSGELLTEFIAGTLLSGLDAELAEFVLAATTCAELDAALATEVTANAKSAELLEQCVREGIFIDRFVGRGEETMYRWHPHFAKQCRIVLARRDAHLRRELNRRAAHALVANHPVKALSHALLGGNGEDALKLLRASWLRIIIDSGAGPLNRLCTDLIAEFGQHGEILLIRACCLDALGDATGSGLLVAQARVLLDAGPETGNEGLLDESWRTRKFAELFLANDPGLLEEAVDAARSALNSRAVDAPCYAYCLFFLGWSEMRLRRNTAEAVRLLKSALGEAQAAGMATLTRRIRSNLIFALSFAGHFTGATALMQSHDEESLQDADRQWDHYDGDIESFARGVIYFWQDKISLAQQCFTAMVDRGGHSSSYTALGRVFLAFCAAASGDARDLSNAQSHLGGISLVERHGVPWPAFRMIAAASIRAGSGDHQGALGLLGSLEGFSNIPAALVLAAEIYRKCGRPNEALAALARIEDSGKVSYVAASALVTSAAIARMQGDRAKAHAQLEQALDIAAPQSIARPFNSGDDALLELLTEHAAWGTSHEGFLAARLAAGNESVSRHEILGAQLSTREREVFAFLRTTMTAEEIAGSLFVSVNTVRTHQRSIYRKLGVGTRREAIKFRL